MPNIIIRKLKTACRIFSGQGLRGIKTVSGVHFVKRWLYPVLTPTAYHALLMYLKLGYWPKISKPRSFNEKVTYRMLYYPHPLSSIVADKWCVRDYVAEKASSEILSRVFWTGKNPELIPFDTLPSKFVIKMNFGSGWNIFVQDKTEIDRLALIKKCVGWLRQKHSKFHRSHEKVYDSIEPLIMIEEYLQEDANSNPTDYKFYCFEGKPTYILTCSGRFSDQRDNFWDTGWNEMPFSKGKPKAEGLRRPLNLSEMLEIARKLSMDFDFCRIDLYNLGENRIVFGEITLTPTGGLGRFYPREWDFRMGALWNIKNYS